ncbi:MAG: AzlC family ABC transporter permease [Candidatus Howiella sp.]|jgi:predicted branched-subunit amino acid permease
MNTKVINSYAAGLRDGLPIGLGYLSVSFAFGILVVKDGLSALTAAAISMTNLTSAGQFAGLSVILAGATLAEMALTQFIINLRYALMSITLSQRMDERVGRFSRLLLAFFVTDEIFAVAASRPEYIGKRYMWGLATAPYIGWSSGTILGALCGGVLPESLVGALGIAIYGMFIAIIIPPAKKERSVLAVVTVASALSCLLNLVPSLAAWFSAAPGLSIILCAVTASTLGALFFPVREEGGATA